MGGAQAEPGASRTRAIRVAVTGTAHEDPRAAIRDRARELGVLGWVRSGDDDTVEVHAEGPGPAVESLVAFVREASRATSAGDVAVHEARVEGHEQFAIRGVSAGAFVVQEHAVTAHHFDLRLELDGAMRSWAVPKGPSMDPAVKRLAVEVGERPIAHNDFEGPTANGAVVIWDAGTYEQGGRVPWPDALDRGHAVFVLHGRKLSGGFALQRTRRGPKAQWLLLKRRDERARPGSDIVAEAPASVRSGRTLAELLREDEAARGR